MTQQQYLKAEQIRLEDCRPGDVLMADDGFPCIPAWRRCTVERPKSGDPFDAFVWCRGGANNRPFNCEHSLVGQIGDDGFLVGFRKVST